MYDSLLDWCTAAVSIVSAGSKNAAGDTIYGEPVVHNCYRADMLTVITDKTGKEVVSATQIYFPPSVAVVDTDMIVLPLDSKKREIKSVGSFIDGSTGAVSIKVVYL